MQLSNKRTLYQVQTESSDSEIIRLRGEATIDGSGKVMNFNGQVMPAVTSDADPGMAHGSFNYSINGDRSNQHIDVPSEYRKEASALLDKTIEKIESEVKSEVINE